MHRLEPLHLKQMLRVFQKNKYHLVRGGDSPRGMRGRGEGGGDGSERRKRGWIEEERMGRKGKGFTHLLPPPLQERLPSLLLSMSVPQHVGDEVYPWKPSAHITFAFQSVSISVDSAVKIPMNSTFLLRERDSFFLSMWFSATKYTYPILMHLVSIPIDRIFLEIWAGSCTGDIIIR